jgi:hypothetical protein
MVCQEKKISNKTIKGYGSAAMAAGEKRGYTKQFSRQLS